jgi:hypothetical protein
LTQSAPAEEQSITVQFVKADSKMSDTKLRLQGTESAQPANPLDAVAETPRAWEEIEAGRYQPKRIKGSCVGRELG